LIGELNLNDVELSVLRTIVIVLLKGMKQIERRQPPGCVDDLLSLKMTTWMLAPV
jgi:hypothetical protein